MPFGTKKFGMQRFGTGRFGTGRFGDLENSALSMTISPTVGTLTQTIGLSVKSSTHAFVDWGDGSALTDVAYVGQYQNYTHTYASAGTYNARLINPTNVTGLRCNTSAVVMSITTLSSLTYLFMNNTSVTGVITNIPLTYLTLYNTAVTGVITNMPLTYLFMSSTGTTVTGVITNIPLTYLFLNDTGTAVTGVITNMPLTYLYMSYTAVTGVITNMPLTYLLLNNTSVTGEITNIPLTSLYLSDTGTAVTGVITNMPLTYLFLSYTSVTGAITNMPLTSLYMSATGTAVTGILNSTARLTREYIDITGEITLPTNRVYGTWGASAVRINMVAHKLTSSETDATLIRLAASPISGSTKTVYIYGESRTVASDAAIAILNTANVSVTITG